MATSRSKPLYRSRLTRLGYHFLFIALFAVIGGSLRGFNLLLVLAGLLTSVVIIQWRQGRWIIRRAHPSRSCPRGAFAGTSVDIDYQVSNNGRWSPIWNIQVEDQLSPRTIEGHTQWEQRYLPADDLSDDEPIALIGSVGYVPPGQSRQTTIQCRFNHRGVYELGPILGSTTFPFCLMRCERLSRTAHDHIYVYPRPLSLRSSWTDLLPPRRGGSGNRSTGGTNHDGEFFGLRPWQSGDQVKHIHWRTTARLGQPAVRQFEQRNRHQICLVVDANRSDDQTTTSEDAELALRMAVTMLNELTSQSRSVAMLVADSLDADSMDSQSGGPRQIIQSNGHAREPLLERLAVAKPGIVSGESADPLTTAISAASGELRKYDLLVVSSRSFAQAMEQTDESELGRKALAVWRHFDTAGRITWLDVTSPDVQRVMNLPEQELSKQIESQQPTEELQHVGR